jgi:hypothetical protein
MILFVRALQSPDTQTFPGAQVVPSSSDHCEVEVDGWQLWQEFAGSAALEAKNAPPIQQPAWQLPEAQIFPAPQLVPSAVFVHCDVAVEGRHDWQELAGLTAPLAYSADWIQQAFWQIPATQISPSPHPVPLSTVDHAVVESTGWQL